jgi:transketolase
MKTHEISMRDAYGEVLVELGNEYPELMVLDADVSSSTRTAIFAGKYPERFFNVGVAEANMVDISAGLALCGLKAIANSFAVFLTLKTTEQIRNVICYNNLPVVLVGSYAGLSDSYDGASHQSIEDIAIMRAIPNLNVIVPADAIELKQAMRSAIKLNAPVYVRICRNPTPVLLSESEPFEFGKIRVVREGTDLTIAACGIAVPIAMEAIEVLESRGLSVELLNISTIKPIDKETLIRSVKKTKRILTVEEHSIIGGLGSAVSEVLSKEYPTKTDYIGVSDTFTETGGYDELLGKYNISTDHIIEKAMNLTHD